MQNIAIEARGLAKSFGGRNAVVALDLCVPYGSVYGLLGPNGAGKTTTVRMLAGLIAPTSGSATVAGLPVLQDERSLSALHRQVGLLTEAPGMWERLSAAYNLKVYARLYGLPNPEGVVERYLRLVGLWERRADAVARLSKGMRQRLAIARALLHEPPVLFLDEPTSGLDPEASVEVCALIEGLRGRGRAILLCTHNLEEAAKLSNRVGIFRNSLMAEGTPDQLRRTVFGFEVEVRLRLPDTPHAHLDRLRAVEGVAGARAEGNRLLLNVRSAEDVLPTLVRELVANRAEVLSVGEASRSLEDVYLAVLDRSGA